MKCSFGVHDTTGRRWLRTEKLAVSTFQTSVFRAIVYCIGDVTVDVVADVFTSYFYFEICPSTP